MVNIIRAFFVCASVLSASGCVRMGKSFVTSTGQIVDANGNPIYPDLEYNYKAGE